MPKSIQLRGFGGTGEPCIFLDRDAWDRGLVVPAYSKRTPRKESAGTVWRRGRSLNRRTPSQGVCCVLKQHEEMDIELG
jgi:hypothetical protein